MLSLVVLLVWILYFANKSQNKINNKINNKIKQTPSTSFTYVEFTQSTIHTANHPSIQPSMHNLTQPSSQPNAFGSRIPQVISMDKVGRIDTNNKTKWINRDTECKPLGIPV